MITSIIFCPRHPIFKYDIDDFLEHIIAMIPKWNGPACNNIVPNKQQQQTLLHKVYFKSAFSHRCKARTLPNFLLGTSLLNICQDAKLLANAHNQETPSLIGEGKKKHQFYHWRYYDFDNECCDL